MVKILSFSIEMESKKPTLCSSDILFAARIGTVSHCFWTPKNIPSNSSHCAASRLSHGSFGEVSQL